jgi:thymidylate synthase
MDSAWRGTFLKVLAQGHVCAPRGKKIVELDHHMICVGMHYPVLRLPQRKVNYKFMAAEALWICTGRSDVAFLDPYNPNMKNFSDDGTILAGAYGPRIFRQLAYVINKLLKDQDTRQATLTIWEPNPHDTKDYPCTIVMDFKIRRGKLNLHVFMRSSDIWLGLPYDVFSFTMVAVLVLNYYNAHSKKIVGLGDLYLTAASSHLYEEHWKKSVDMVSDIGDPLPPAMFTSEQLPLLDQLKDTAKGDPLRWWEKGVPREN